MPRAQVTLACLRDSGLGAEGDVEEEVPQCPGRRESACCALLLTTRLEDVSDGKTLNQSPEKPAFHFLFLPVSRRLPSADSTLAGLAGGEEGVLVPGSRGWQ